MFKDREDNPQVSLISFAYANNEIQTQLKKRGRYITEGKVDQMEKQEFKIAQTIQNKFD